MELTSSATEKVKLKEVNPYLTCYLCKGYFIDATTISECLHSFCRSCIIKFLQDNSYCPVCEVIINKAKPNLKLDKTLQDIVYKLVPELFLKEMTRRKAFYKSFPTLATRLSPEERGEDTERTIYNPKDFISLSMEYISNDSTPGAIQIPKTDKDDNKESIMKRYLQCPGMCRVDVLKKFVRNKYNVDTAKFYIDILHKRVPLPDHYTLIDIAYIYAWKRNEPMTFFFRITDLNKVSERFDHFDATKANFEYFPKPPTRTRRRESNPNRRRVAKLRKEAAPEEAVANSESVSAAASVCDSDKSVVSAGVVKSEREEGLDDIKREPDKIKEEKEKKTEELKATPNTATATVESSSKTPATVTVKPTKIENEATNNQKTYTNITLNRSEGVEIITKIQQVQNKEGKPIGRQIVQTVRKGSKVAIPKLSEMIAAKGTPPEINRMEQEDVPGDDPFEDEKCKFLRNIHLKAKTVSESNADTTQKRKNSSPVKIEKVKKTKVEKKGVAKIIITQKPTKPTEPDKKRDNGLQSLIDSCRINIPSSLSITIKESGTESRLQTPIPPVKNFIEILKLPDEDVKEKAREKISELASKFCDTDSEQKVDQDLSEIAKSLTEKIPMSTTVSQVIGPKPNFQIPVQSTLPKFPILPSPVPELKEASAKTKTSSFQKIFEESIKKPTEPPKADDETGGDEGDLTEGAPPPQKKSKSEESEVEPAPPKVSIPRLTNAKVDPPAKHEGEPKNSQMNLHSSSLGLNYSVSVGQNSPAKTSKVNGMISPEEKPSNHFKNSPKPKKPSPKFCNSPRNSSPKSSPMVKHMYAPTMFSQPRYASISPKPPAISPKPGGISPKTGVISPKPGVISPKPGVISPKPGVISPKPGVISPKSGVISPKPGGISPKPGVLSPKLSRSGGASPKRQNSPKLANISPKPSAKSPGSNGMSTNEILEKYKIQNLAQLTASLNFNAANFAMSPTNQLAAIQHAMLLKHIEMQNRQNWLNMNQGPLLQYEKYLQSLNGGQSHLLGNIKEN